MASHFYPRLAAGNLKKNAQTYLPYILTCICASSMFYIVHALSQNPGTGDGTVKVVLMLGVYVMAIFSVLFLFYTNSFLMKRRKKEFGLFNILGMEKKHLFRIIFFENLYTFLISMVLGLGFGILFSKLVHLLLLKLLKSSIRFGFFISVASIQFTLALFGGIFILLLLFSLLQIQFSRPIELIHGGETGEKEPKAKWVLAILGVLCLGVAYYISVTTENPMLVLVLFFLAVVLVIIGTYLLFIAGGVAFLKLLKRNKNYYYKSNHFISVSGLMYRMKQNAAGLATICILSTMVLVMISSTAALYFGMEDDLNAQYPRDVMIRLYDIEDPREGRLIRIKEEVLAAYDGVVSGNELDYHMLNLFGYRNGTELVIDGIYNSDYIEFVLMPLKDYASISGEFLSLADDELLLISTGAPYGQSSLKIGGMIFRVQELLEPASAAFYNDVYSQYSRQPSLVYLLIASNLDVIGDIHNAIYDENGYYDIIRHQFGFDLNADDETVIAITDEISRQFRSNMDGGGFSINSRAQVREGLYELYGGLFFLGLYLGFVFILATVLIIYYKQISEGYDDQKRYQIMKKVGLSRREAKRSINSQILTMFFFPLLMACVHICFAFPALSRMLAMLELTNTSVFVLSTGLCALVFTLFYVLVYHLTAGVYYKIVDSDS